MANVNLPDGDKWDAAEEQALAGFDMDLTEDDGDGQSESEDELRAGEDDAGAEIEDDEDSVYETEDQDTGESTAPEDEEESVAFDPQNWDGDLNSLPEETRKLIDPIYKTMERGMHNKFQELARIRKEYENKMAELVSKPTQQPAPAQPDGPPPAPVGTETPEQQQAMWDKRDEWFAAKALEKQAEKMGLSKKDERVELLVAEREQQRRIALVQSQEGFRPEIGQAMASIAQQHPYYQNMLDSDEGILVLFHTAKNALEAHELRQQSAKTKQALASKADADIKKKASAAKGAISRTGTRKASPAETFAKTFEDAEKNALAEFESLR